MMKRVYSTTDLLKADLVQVKLRDRGIESNLENAGAALYAFGQWLDITVCDEDTDRATAILNESFAPTQQADFGKSRPRRHWLWRFGLLLPVSIVLVYDVAVGEWDVAARVALALAGF